MDQDRGENRDRFRTHRSEPTSNPEDEPQRACGFAFLTRESGGLTVTRIDDQGAVAPWLLLHSGRSVIYSAKSVPRCMAGEVGDEAGAGTRKTAPAWMNRRGGVMCAIAVS